MPNHTGIPDATRALKHAEKLIIKALLSGLVCDVDNAMQAIKRAELAAVPQWRWFKRRWLKRMIAAYVKAEAAAPPASVREARGITTVRITEDSDPAILAAFGMESPQCAHGVAFYSDAAKGLSVAEVRERWPRLYGKCPLGCGFDGIAYASTEHYVAGDW